jgi:hypothetical protein
MAFFKISNSYVPVITENNKIAVYFNVQLSINTRFSCGTKGVCISLLDNDVLSYFMESFKNLQTAMNIHVLKNVICII